MGRIFLWGHRLAVYAAEMNTPPPTTEQRLARLESNARRWRLAAVGLAGLVIGGLVVGFGPGDEYRGDFDLIDEEILDYLEAGGVFPVPKVVSVIQIMTGSSNIALLRTWSDGSTEIARSIYWTFDNSTEEYYVNISGNGLPVPEAFWSPVRAEQSDRP